MSKFYGTVNGAARTEATRRGHDFIKVSAQSWDGSLITRMHYDHDGRLIVQLSWADGSSSCYGRTIFEGTLDELEAKLSAKVPAHLAYSKSALISGMEAAGCTYDEIDSTDSWLVFNGEYGNTVHFESWDEVADWLNGVVFDDPDVADRVYCAMNKAGE